MDSWADSSLSLKRPQVCSVSFQLAETNSDLSDADHNSKQTFSRQIDMPDSAFTNPFQVFPISRLLHFGPYLCPDVCSSEPYMESQRGCAKMALAIQNFPLGSTSNKDGEMCFLYNTVGFNQVKGHFAS